MTNPTEQELAKIEALRKAQAQWRSWEQLTDRQRVTCISHRMRYRDAVDAILPRLIAAARTSTQPAAGAVERVAFQGRVNDWLIACFGEVIARDKAERNHRFLEESLELAQACGCTASEAHQLVDYTFARPVGERPQEIGGVMNTLAALCLAHGEDMDACADAEIERCWQKIERIREKQRNKPKHSPLPAALAAMPDVAGLVRALEQCLPAMQYELDCILDSGCSLDKRGEPIRDTLTDDLLKSDAERLEAAIEVARAALAQYRGEK